MTYIFVVRLAYTGYVFAFLFLKFTYSCHISNYFPSSIPVNSSNVILFEFSKFSECDPGNIDFSLQYLGEENIFASVPLINKVKRGQSEIAVHLPKLEEAGYAFLVPNISSNPIALKVFNLPRITAITPASTTATGQEDICLNGVNLFPSLEALVYLKWTVNASDHRISVSPTFRNGSYCFQFPLLSTLSQTFESVNIQVCLALNGMEGEGNTETTLTVLPKKPLKVGYVIEDLVSSSEWGFQLNVARTNIDTQFQGFVVSNISEGVHYLDFPSEVLNYCNAGFDLVVLRARGHESSFANISRSLACNSTNSSMLSQGTKALVFGLPLPVEKVSSVVTRWYEVRYVHGLLAGHLFKENKVSGQVGYLASYPSSESFRSINAFLVGCREIHSNCRVKVIWLHTWHDEDLEKSAALKLWVGDNVRILVQDTEGVASLRFFSGGLASLSTESMELLASAQINSTNLEGSETGFSFGPIGDLRRLAGNSVLSGMESTCQRVLEQTISALLREDLSKFGKVTWNQAETVMDMFPNFSPWVSIPTQEFLLQKAASLLADDTSIFCDPITTNNGEMVEVLYQPNNSFDVGNTCNLTKSLDEQCCLSDGSGVSDMDYLLEGVDFPTFCIDLSGCPLGLVVPIQTQSNVEIAYFKLYETSTVSLATLCDDQQSEDANSITLEFSVHDNTLTDEFTIEWDYYDTFNSSNRNCDRGVLCMNLLESELEAQSCQKIESLDDRTLYCYQTTLDGLTDGIRYFFRLKLGSSWSSRTSSASSCSTAVGRTLDIPGRATVVALNVLLSLLGISTVPLLYILFKKRKHKDMKQFGNVYWGGLSCGICLMWITGFMLLNLPKTDSLCNKLLITGTMAITFMLGTLAVRAEEIREGKRKKPRQIIKETLVFYIINAMLLGFNMAFNPYTLQAVDAIYSETKSVNQCVTDSIGLGALVQIYLMYLILLVALRLYKIRKSQTRFNDKKRIALFLCGAAASQLIVLPVQNAPVKPDFKMIVLISRVIILSGMVMALFLIPLCVAIGEEGPNRSTFLESLIQASSKSPQEGTKASLRPKIGVKEPSILDSNSLFAPIQQNFGGTNEEKPFSPGIPAQVYPLEEPAAQCSVMEDSYGDLIEQMAELHEEIDAVYDEYESFKDKYKEIREKLASVDPDGKLRERFPSWDSEAALEQDAKLRERRTSEESASTKSPLTISLDFGNKQNEERNEDGQEEVQRFEIDDDDTRKSY